jgi:hypothetical protein
MLAATSAASSLRERYSVNEIGNITPQPNQKENYASGENQRHAWDEFLAKVYAHDRLNGAALRVNTKKIIVKMLNSDLRKLSSRLVHLAQSEILPLGAARTHRWLPFVTLFWRMKQEAAQRFAYLVSAALLLQAGITYTNCPKGQ